VTTIHGPRRVTSATKYFLKIWTTLVQSLHVKILEPALTWQLLRLRQFRMCSIICGQDSEMRKPTPGSVSMIVARQQVPATTLLMELSLSPMDQVSLSLQVHSRTKMLNGRAMTTLSPANQWPTLKRDRSKIASRLIKL